MGWIRREAWKLRLSALGPVLPNLALLQSWQYLPSQQLAELQQKRLHDLLLHAYRSTDYFRETLDACGVVSSDGTVHLDRFGAVPLLDKELLRSEFERLKSTDLERRSWYVNASGGSTGEPARFVQDREFDAWVGAVKLLFDDWTGCRIGDRKAVLWGSSRDVDGSRHPLRVRAGRWLSNELWLRAFRLTDEDMMAHARAINAFRPVQLLAYAGSVYELSRVVDRAGMKMFSPRAIMTSAGTMYPAMRDTIEGAFGAPVFDRYGSRDLGDVACECEQHRGLHVAAPFQHVEILRSDGDPVEPGEEGEIVITNLANYAMPLIRYRIGDTGIWSSEPCSCGRSWPLLGRVTGRVSDFFVNGDGVQVPGEFFVHELRTQDWLRRFRIVQETVDHVDVYVQPIGAMGEEEVVQLGEIESLVRRAMGAGCTVSIKIVADIEPTPSGKYLSVISKVHSLDDARH